MAIPANWGIRITGPHLAASIFLSGDHRLPSMALRDVNLLAISDCSFPVESKVEVEDVLSLVKARADLEDLSGGTFGISTEEDPREVISRLGYLHRIEPEKFEYTVMWMPADWWAGPEIEDVVGAITQRLTEVSKDRRLRVVIETVGSVQYRVGELVSRVARLMPEGRDSEELKTMYIYLTDKGAIVSLVDPSEILETGHTPRNYASGLGEMAVTVD